MTPAALRSRRLRSLALALGAAFAVVAGLELGLRGVLLARGTPYDSASARARIEELLDVRQAAYVAPELEGREDESGRDPTELLLHPFLGFAPRGKTLQLAGELRRGAGTDAEGDYEILILGGSVAGMFHAHGGERLIELLRADPRFAERTIRLVPFSTGGYKQPQQSIRLLELLHHGYEPDAVLEIDGYNELALGSANAAAGTNPYYPSVSHWAHLIRGGAGDPRLVEPIVEVHELRREIEETGARMLRLGLYRSCVLGRVGLARLERLRAREVESFGRYAELLAEGSEPTVLRGPEFDRDERAPLLAIARAWEEASRTMHDVCGARGIHYLHVLQPALHDEGSKPLTPREVEAGTTRPAMQWGVRAGYPLLREGGERLRAQGVGFVDASDLFAEETETLYRDPCHYDRKGSILLAERIAPAFLSGLAR